MKNQNIAVGYVRVNDNSQDAIEIQKNAIHNYAKDNGIKIKSWFIDINQTGTTSGPELRDLVKQSKKKTFGNVLIYKFDRLGRNLEEGRYFKIKLIRNQVKVISVTEPPNNSPKSVLFESILTAIGLYYNSANKGSK